MQQSTVQVSLGVEQNWYVAPTISNHIVILQGKQRRDLLEYSSLSRLILRFFIIKVSLLSQILSITLNNLLIAYQINIKQNQILDIDGQSVSY